VAVLKSAGTSSQLLLVCVADASVVVPPSAYAIVGPTALNAKTAMIADEIRDVRVILNIDPPSDMDLLITLYSSEATPWAMDAAMNAS
jgi:hypothetical protein